MDSCAGPVSGTDLLVDVAHVPSGRALGDHQFLGIRLAGGDQTKHLHFSRGEAVGAGWSFVSENTAGAQSLWSDTSSPLGGDRLVAQWLIDSALSAAGDSFGVSLGTGTFAGTDLSTSPFFELLSIATLDGTLLTQVMVGGAPVVPEPSALLLFGSGLLVAASSVRPRR